MYGQSAHPYDKLLSVANVAETFIIVRKGDKIMAETAIYGYIRVSSKDQNEERQRRAMEEYAISPRNMIVDRQSGKDFERPGYRRLMKK